MNKIVDRIIALLKRWSRYDDLDDAMLLSRYGARNIDELYVMIMMNRTAEPTGLWETNFKTLPVKITSWLLTVQQTHKIISRHSKEELAKQAYKTKVKQELEDKKFAKRQAEYEKMVKDYDKMVKDKGLASINFSQYF